MFSDTRDILRAIATTVVPEAKALAESEWEDVERIIASALSKRPPVIVRQVMLFLRTVQRLPLLRYGARFTSLDDARRAQVLNWLQDNRIFLLRKGMWGLRTLVLMGYYARPAAADEIGYRANARGWEVARGSAGKSDQDAAREIR